MHYIVTMCYLYTIVFCNFLVLVFSFSFWSLVEDGGDEREHRSGSAGEGL